MWSDWLEVWDRHSRSERFEKRLSVAAAICHAAEANCDCMYLALSGGKDGVAVAAVLAHAGIKVQAAHCHTELNTPGMLECAEQTAKILGFDLDIVEPDIDGSVWDLLAKLPDDKSIMYGPLFDTLLTKIASGNMLVAYQYASGFTGSYSGMRAAESRGRRMNRKVRGPLYRLESDGTWMCSPISDWSARDTFAAAVRFGLPICDHYRRLFERLEVHPESPASRVDCLLVSDGIGARGGYTQAKLLYPEIWRRLIMVRPELAREV